DKFDSGTTVDAAALHEKGLIPDMKQPAKILGNGDLSKKLTVSAGWYSKSAHEKITKAGGSAQNLKGEAFEFPKPKKKFVKREKEQPQGGGKKKQKSAAIEGAEGAPEAAAPAATEAPAPPESPKAE